eukprot:CAMPEP_0179416072 /NCGR_PEP_ID=MMETSP0799-20121207/6592_1 /TAXON_ID=46947 /ORGANISM="Geminigera cryophila, Strain CCMP2564" /LENGTH=65 /DNA_ID=CAMNT_0021188897 /DNA_START=117 /DNA_END=311 /DNA_ORIENTATION=+
MEGLNMSVSMQAEDAEALAEFVLMSIGNERMDLTSVPTYCVKRDDLVEEEGARECNFVAHIDVLH